MESGEGIERQGSVVARVLIEPWNPVKELKVAPRPRRVPRMLPVESGEGIESPSRVVPPFARFAVESGEGIESLLQQSYGVLNLDVWNPVKELKVFTDITFDAW